MVATMKDVLILAGSAEGHALAKALPEARAVLPEPLRHDPGGVAYEIAPKWSAALVAEGRGPVILATHPCDASLRVELPEACRAAGRPLLHLLRSSWTPLDGDRWITPTPRLPLPRCLPHGERVFVGIGREVREYQEVLADRYLVIRQLSDEGRTWPGRGHYLPGSPPFSVAEEVATLQAERIDWLLVKNAGGRGGWPKLMAARQLGLPVVMLRRPPKMPDVPVAVTLRDAMVWLDAQGVTT